MRRPVLHVRPSWSLLLCALLLVLVAPGGALAHTGFQSSTPADGSTSDSPVRTVTIVFGGPATPIGTAFEARTPDGTIVKPQRESALQDGSRWALTFNPPLAGGEVAVRWKVRAADGHPINGAFTFIVDAPAQAAPTADAGISDSVDEFTSGGGTAVGARQLAAIGRIAIVLGILLAIGATAFGVGVLRGSRSEVRYAMHWIRRGGALAVLGSVVRFIAWLGREAGSWQDALAPSTVADVVTSGTGVSILLSLCGGFGVAFAARGRTRPASGIGDPLHAIGSSDVLSRHFSHFAHAHPDRPPLTFSEDRVWDRSKSSPAILAAGLAALAISPLFVGHTVTQGNRVLTSIADLIHVVAGSIWVGGLVVLGGLLARRLRRPGEPRMLQLVLRFSVSAAVAVTAVMLTGLVQAVIILDSPGEIVSTSWGRVLLIKTAFALTAGAIGAYNHRVLLPALVHDSADRDAQVRVRSTVRAEAVAALTAGAIAALLISAAA